MAILHSPDIVTDQLKFHVDAQNPKSFAAYKENLFQYSENFNSTYWQGGNVTVTQKQLDPYGKYRATKVQTTNVSYGCILRTWNCSYSANTTYTMSVYAKRGNYQYIGLRPQLYSSYSDPLGGEKFVSFDLLKGRVINDITVYSAATFVSANMVSVGNGWFRCSVTVTTPSSLPNNICDIALVRYDGYHGWTPTGTEYVYIYGAQLEKVSYESAQTTKVSFPTTYTPTYGTPVTFSGDKNNWKDLISGGNLYYGDPFQHSDGIMRFRESNDTYGYLSNFDNGILKNENRTGQWTLEAYFKHVGPTKINPYGENVIIGRAGCHGGIYINADNSLNYAIKTNNGNCWAGSMIMFVDNLVPGNIYHTVFTYNNGIAKAYLNGVPSRYEATKTFDLVNNTFFAYGNTLWVGGIGTTFNPNADIYSARAYSKELSATEVLKNYNAMKSKYTYSNNIIASDLQIYLSPENEISYVGTGSEWNDISGVKNYATLYNSPKYDSNSLGGKYLTFNGTNQYASIADSANIKFSSTQAFTLSAWIKPTVLQNQWTGIVTKSRDTADWYGIWINPENKITWGGYGFNLFGPTATTEWQHVVISQDASNKYMYVNGVLSLTYPVVINANGSGAMYIGKGTDSEFFNGSIADVTLNNRLLTANEVLQNFNANKDKYIVGKINVISQSLISHLDASYTSSYAGTGNTFIDLSGNGNNGTLSATSYNYSTNALSFSTSSSMTMDSINLYNTNYTIMYLARITGTSLRVLTAKNNNWLLGYWSNSSSQYYADGWVSSVGGTATTSDWVMWTGTGNISTDKYSLWKNSNKIITDNSGGSHGPNVIGVNVFGGEPSACEIAAILVYDRVLDDWEIQQNFEAYRSRYSL